MFASPPQSIYQSKLSSQQPSMEDRTNMPEFSDTKESPLSPSSNLEVIDSSDNIPLPISNLINDRNVQQTPCSGPCPTSRKSEPSKPAENPIITTADSSPPRLEKELHPLEENKNRTSNPSTSPDLPPHNFNSTAPKPAEPDSDSESQTLSEHSSGSDAAFYCSIGSPSEDEEDGSGASLVLGAEAEGEGEIGGEGESGLTKKTLREAVSTSGTDVAADSGGAEDKEEAREEENEIHNKNSKRRKSEKRFTFLKRLFGRKKLKVSSGDAGIGGGI
ncbi:uncharacterized protein Bfra_008990 [Botrytis fragariae]|uniref:Uncharacterized protein n=1 Tax=Botrytis fragariae TaxID=1964551 RepID=A0A8H6AR43_9HELO|nr:uncharacterized protein Bfra_008990 [Botrytis fragariae]KAF5871963.1 hypothetical protein Bfra_008990 [Botrytis fragariae]